MKVLLIGDVHLADKPPRACTNVYSDNLLDMLEEAFEKAVSYNVELIGLAGDIFHHKNPSKTSYEIVGKLAKLLHKSEVPVVAAIGNHDLWHDSYELFKGQPLYALHAADLIQFDHPEVFFWHWGKELQPEDSHKLVIAHQAIGKPDNPLIWDEVQASDVAEKFDGPVFFGHTHDDLGTFTVGSTTFCNNGALCRGTLANSDLRRNPCVTLLEDGNFSRVELENVLPIDELYNQMSLDSKFKLVDRHIDLDNWFLRLSDAGPVSKVPPRERAIKKIEESPVEEPVKVRSIGLLSDG